MVDTAGSEVLELLIRLRDQASKNLDNVDDALKSVQRTTKRTTPVLARFRGALGRVSSVAFSIKGALAGLGIGLLTKSFLDAASASENFRVRLVRLLGSVEEGNRAFDVAAGFASQVAFEYEDILGSTTALSGVLKGGVDEIKQFLPIVADLAAVSGLSIEETTGQIIRLYSAGAGAADLFRERGILAMLGFQAGVSVSAEETRKTLIEAFESPTSKFRGAAEDLGKTWTGLLSLVSDAIFQFKNAIADAGSFDFIKAGLAEVLVIIKEFTASKTVVKNTSDFIVSAIEVIIKAAALAGDAFRGWQFIWNGLRGGFAVFLSFISNGLAVIADAADFVRAKFNEFIGDIKNIAPALKFLGGPTAILGGVIEQLENADIKIGEAGDSLRANASYWEEIAFQSNENLENLASQQSYLSRAEGFLGRIRDRAAEYAKEAEKGSKKVVPPGSDTVEGPNRESQLASELNRLEEDAKTQLQALEPYYQQSLDKLNEYFAARERTTREAASKERELLELKASGEDDVNKRQKINDAIYSLDAKLNRDLFDLQREQEAALKEHEENKLAIRDVFRDVDTRLRAGGIGDLQTQFRTELAELQTKQESELELLREHNATKEELSKLHRQHELEQEQLLTDQIIRQSEARLGLLASVAGSTSKILQDVFDLTGKKNKKLFYASKAAAILEATINVATGVTKAIAQGGYLGLATGILVAATGAVQIAKIQSQSLAEGGIVSGYSPTPTADNVPINATAGEFMEPVKAVKHYGLGFMESVRNLSFPKELTSKFSIPSLPSFRNKPNPRTNYAEGGEISPIGGGQGGVSQASQKTNIVNVLDPSVFDQYVASTPGQNNILNVMRNNVFELRQLVFDNKSS